MSLLASFVLFGWVPLTIILFFTLKPHQSVLVSIIGGWLFLPMCTYELPGLPDFTKSTAIALGLILGGRISGKRQASSFRWSAYDIPIILWTLCPLATSLANQLGLSDGLSGIWDNITIWGIPYLAGRIYFDDLEKLRSICHSLVLGGLLYLPLCLFEIRMSPQLSNMIYDFFPHSFVQHIRYGGFRPIVFMQHGLMVSLWMAVSTTTLFWLWQNEKINQVNIIRKPLSFLVMAITTILCKSANGWITLVVGCGSYYMYKWTRSVFYFRLLLLLIPFYIALRIHGILESGSIESFVASFLDEERSGSLGLRLLQEDLFVKKTLESLLFGWGGYARGWPIDPTGRLAIQMIDALWLIIFNTNGLFGITNWLATLLIGPWLIFRYLNKNILNINFDSCYLILLSLIVILFIVDSLVNSMINPVYIMISGSLSGYALRNVSPRRINNFKTAKGIC